jgi:hypothetical protein
MRARSALPSAGSLLADRLETVAHDATATSSRRRLRERIMAE